MNFYQEIIAELKENEFNSKQFAKLKRELSQKYKLRSIPTNIEIHSGIMIHHRRLIIISRIYSGLMIDVFNPVFCNII